MTRLLSVIVLGALMFSAPLRAETVGGIYDETVTPHEETQQIDEVDPHVAAEVSHGDGHEEDHGKGGLPQFDPTWFASQVFWLAVCFAFLYFYFATRTLPDISSVLQNRKNHIQSDLETAERLQGEAESVQASYERTLDVARSNAANAVSDVETAIRKKAEEQQVEFQKRAEKKLQDVEVRIDAVKNEALVNMNDIAADVAAHAVKKIIGVQSDRDHVRSIVDSLSDKAKAA